MKTVIKWEEAGMVLLSVFAFNQTAFPWWLYPLLILVPDIGMLGYLVNPRIGALTYNIFHHKGIAIFLWLIGWYWSIPWAELIGIILFGHSSLDRIFGFGLKYPDDFKNTHLGRMD
ncbi:DUF4260 domain-containing protein [Membranihabitans maritimus]|uniref:DUF4260 domain-containing protein n=1 Tax=Membranihabitans maritimus TaxID=2904244 RepID=UPI001F248A60|nr:DUF4260 domain-containing protein [Membranihabitans maritimus]